MLNAREARWYDRPGRGMEPSLQGQGDFPQIGLGLSVLFAVGALENHTVGSRVEGTLDGRDDWGAYTVDEAALRHGAGVEEETNDRGIAYAGFPEPEPTRYREGSLR